MRRLALLCVAMFALIGGTFAPEQAHAFGWERDDGIHDPYFYRPGHRGYYPYYNSGQWRPAKDMRWRKRVARQHFYYPQYNPVWGHPVNGYRNREFHARDGHRHWIGHW